VSNIRDDLTQENIQQFLEKYRSPWFVSGIELGLCSAKCYGRNGHEDRRQANSWSQLLQQFIDWHDKTEIEWLTVNGLLITQE
jgi:hypothetical protein